MSQIWVVTYDIADDRRRRQVARALCNHMARVQESVFEGRLTPAMQRRLEQQAAALIEAGEDGIRFYPLLLREAACRQVDGLMLPLPADDVFWIL
jgi:CRISPR-associated protein Cas2